MSVAFDKGIAALGQEDFKLAEVGFAQALHEDPKDARAMIYLLYARVRRRRYSDSTNLLQNALKLAPRDTVVLRTIACIQFHTDEAAKAIATLQRAVRIDSGEAETHALLASYYLSLRRRPEGEAELKEALRLDPDNEAARQARAAFDATFADPSAPERKAIMKLPRTPESSPAHLQAGRACIARGDVPQGVWHLREATRLDPKSVEASESLKRALRNQFRLFNVLHHLATFVRKYRFVASFGLVYITVKLVMWATQDPTVSTEMQAILLAAAVVMCGLMVLLLAPMPLAGLLIRLHPVGRYSPNETHKG